MILITNTNNIFKSDEDDDTKWCICGHHIVSHVEAGGQCTNQYCYNNCNEFIPCTIMSAQECAKRYKLLLLVIRERFVIRHFDILKLLKIKVDAKFRDVIDKCLQLKDIDIYELRNFVVRKIMRPKNISNLNELDIYLKKFHEVARPLIYSDKELVRSEYHRRSRIVARETRREKERLLKEDYLPKISRTGWSTFKDYTNNRLMAIRSKRDQNGKQKTVVIGPLPEERAWEEYKFKLWVQATKVGCERGGFGWCLEGLSLDRIKKFNALRYKGLILKDGDRIADEFCTDLGIKYSKTHGSFNMRPDSTIKYCKRKIDEADREIKARDGIENWYELDALRMAKQEQEDVDKAADDNENE
jgi:hypothetical protein